MRLVVDSNRLQSDELRRYLAGSSKNFAVLTDYAAMEAHKGDTLASIYKSMEIVCAYPAQILVLKTTGVVCGLSGRASGLQSRLIDKAQTKGFHQYARALARARGGGVALSDQLLAKGRDASDQMARMLNDADKMRSFIDDIKKMYSKQERAAVRTGETYPPGFVDRTVKNVMYTAALLFRDHPNVRHKPTYEQLANTFIFRAALCNYLLALDWGANGGAHSATAETLRNDVVDMSFATYGTYFDGVLTGDGKVERIHQEARVWLSALFNCHLPGGVLVAQRSYA